MDINTDNLENALSNTGAAPAAPATEAAPTQPQAPEMPKDVEVGFHQGALNTLAAERAELFKMIQNVEKIMGMHIQRLEQLGIKVQTQPEGTN